MLRLSSDWFSSTEWMSLNHFLFIHAQFSTNHAVRIRIEMKEVLTPSLVWAFGSFRGFGVSFDRRKRKRPPTRQLIKIMKWFDSLFARVTSRSLFVSYLPAQARQRISNNANCSIVIAFVIIMSCELWIINSDYVYICIIGLDSAIWWMWTLLSIYMRNWKEKRKR